MAYMHTLIACAVFAALVAVCKADDAFEINPVSSKQSSNASSDAIFNRFCYSHPSSIPSCSIGPFAPLSKRAPEPQTVGGRLAAKTAAYMYTCYQRDGKTCETDSICYWVDVESYCTVTSTFLQKLRYSTVCEDSKADIYTACSALDKNESMCGTDKRCKWVPCNASSCVTNSESSKASGSCLGNIASLLANDASVLSDLEDGDNSAWGCCDSQQLYEDMKTCLDIDGPIACTGNCQWNDMRNECEAGLSSQYAIWGNKDTNFSNYLSTLDTECQASATEHQCVAAQKVVDIDPAKVAKYLSVSLKTVENSCKEVLETETSSDTLNSTTPSGGSTQLTFNAGSISQPVAAWAFALLAVVAVLL